jgi:hypothetical protein
VATFDHSIPASARPALRASSDHITRMVMKVLAGSLAAVYLFSAVTMPAGHGAVAVGEAAIAASQLAWVALVSIGARRSWVYGAGIALQLVLTALWIVTRTTGLPGIGRLPVGEFDLLCALDALMVAGLCWRCAPWAHAVTPRLRLCVCQLAVILAACTVYMSMASMMAMTAPPSAVAGSGAGTGAGSGAGSGAGTHGAPGQTAQRFFCHLL